MSDQYRIISEMSKLHGLLQDELSRALFWTRFEYDVDPSIGHAFQMVRTAVEGKTADSTAWENILQALDSKSKKVILYGTGVQGKVIANLFARNKKDFTGFCGRDYQTYSETGIMGKPVFSPQYVLDHADDCYVIIATVVFYAEIYDYLIEHDFPLSHILLFSSQVNAISDLYKKQYFDFPELYEKGTAFVDAGCFDCTDSIRFRDWCGGMYSEILAFEPDDENFDRCGQIAKDKNLQRFKIFNFGVGKSSGKVMFESQLGSSSHVVELADAEDLESECVFKPVQIIALDEVVGDVKVGFIKMDIEGAEYDALLGAEHILLRDKPLLAICIYHKRGDMLQIMEYLHQLIPEYRFWIRHYNISMNETVLYAAIPALNAVK